jgi:AcrR family transcriptional regulator
MATTTQGRASARDRLLAAASELFYAEGVHTVGIDRVIERAGVAKASLYATFGSKDGLVRAYLDGQHAAIRERLAAGLQRYSTPRERLIGVFELQSERFAQQGYRGCAFIRASAESDAGGTVQQAADSHRGWLRALLTDLAEQAGAADPAALARQLCLLYDGAVMAAWMDRDPHAAHDAVSTARLLVDSALG